MMALFPYLVLTERGRHCPLAQRLAGCSLCFLGPTWPNSHLILGKGFPGAHMSPKVCPSPPCHPTPHTPLTKPCLLLPLNLYGQAKVCQLHSRTLELRGQQQILRLPRTRRGEREGGPRDSQVQNLTRCQGTQEEWLNGPRSHPLPHLKTQGPEFLCPRGETVARPTSFATDGFSPGLRALAKGS